MGRTPKQPDQAAPTRRGVRGRGGAWRRDSARWHAVLASARDAIISVDGAGRIALFNRCAEQMFGYRAEEVLGQNVSVLMPSPDREAHDHYIAAYQRTGAAKAIGRIREVTAMRKGGACFPAELSVSESGVDGEPFYTAILRDVSELRRLQGALERERDFARRLIEEAPSIIVVLGEGGEVWHGNARLCKAVGVSLDAIIGRDFASALLAQEDQGRFSALRAQALSGVEVKGAGLDLRTGAGARRVVAWSIARLDAGGEWGGGLLLTGQDLTEQTLTADAMHAYRAMATQRQHMADFSALIAQLMHDLASPLAGLSAQAQLIQGLTEGQPALEVVRGAASQIQRETLRMQGQLREFLRFSRQQQRLNPAPIDAPTWLAEVVAVWRPVAALHAITLEGRCAPTLTRFTADADKLRRACDNLIRNAIEALSDALAPPPDAKSVWISLQHASDGATGGVQGGVQVVVEDNGPGVSPDARLFQLLETTKEGGNGLGLLLARQFAHMHGGDLRHTPRLPHGARFTLDLPRARACQG